MASTSLVAQVEYFAADDDKYRNMRLRCGMMCAVFNALPTATTKEERLRAWQDIVNERTSSGVACLQMPSIKVPITIGHGVNVKIAASCQIDRNCVIGDSPVHLIEIGERTVIRPGVQIYGVMHPDHGRQHSKGKGLSLTGPVKIGNDCVLGDHSVIMPGVTIGDGCVVGASSVVHRSIPAGHVAVGSPAVIVRKVDRKVLDAPDLRCVEKGGRVVVYRTASDVQKEVRSTANLSTWQQAANAEADAHEVLRQVSRESILSILAEIAWLAVAVGVGLLMVHSLLQ